jgi:glycosyltransferase involved in cell wall biosynthesis
MRFLIDGHTLFDHFTGIGRYTFHLIEELAALAPADQFVVPLNPRLPNRRFDLARFARMRNVTLVETSLTPFQPQYQFALASKVRTIDLFGLVHFSYYIRPYWRFPRSAVTIFDLTPLKFPQTLPTRAHRWLYHLMLRLALRASRLIFTTSNASRTDLQQAFSLRQKTVTVTPLAVEPRFKRAEEAAINALRARWNLPPRFLLALRMNKPHKNLPTLLQAFARAETDTPLVLAGFHDPRFADPQAQVAQLGIAKRVRFVGAPSDDELPILYSAAVAFAMPSLYEGFGLPVLEAMACGTPVVCSNSSSLPEVAGDAALLVAPRDVDGWADAITRLLSDEALRAQLSARGMMRAGEFSWARMAGQTYDVYRAQMELW